ncbi:MAG: hypothetical protein KY393_05575 [Actinobacteria bacterium]|nr:hypothetical protein [Actinomycetota bacterium]
MAAATVKPTPTATKAMTETGIAESVSTPLSDDAPASTPDPVAVGDSDIDPAVGDPSGDGEGLDAGEGVGLGLGLGLALSEGDAGDADEPGVFDELDRGLEAVTRKLLDS